MNLIRKLNPEWFLRLGFGLMFLYSGYSLYYYSASWLWAIPMWLKQIIMTFSSLEFYLKLQGIAEFVMGLLFLAWFSGRRGLQIASGLAFIEMAAITTMVGVDLITFRDIGLLGGAAALFIMSSRPVEA